MILDTAAGALIAAIIVGTVCFGLTLADVSMKQRDSSAPGWIIALMGFSAGLALIAWRVMRAHS